MGISEGKEKPPIFDRGALAGGGDDETRGAGRIGAASPARNARAGAFNAKSDGEQAISGKTGRFEQFRAEVLRYWAGQNQSHSECPWLRGDSRALAQFLEGSPSVTFEDFQNCLRNRAASEVNPSELPRHWLAHLMEYLDGPLDRYRKPFKPVRQW
ncbi:MAG TPA: hypothetical protein VGH83_01035 [Candidatus Acidoferrum sp.]|jgi:hypothetical protein